MEISTELGKLVNYFFVAVVLYAFLSMVGCSGNNDKQQELIELKPPSGEKRVPLDTKNSMDVLPDTVVITHIAVIKTTVGTITIGLFGNSAPTTVLNFTELCKRKYYDGILFHRVAKGFVLQAGDPLTRDTTKKGQWGNGGETYNGKLLEDEVDTASLAMKMGYSLGTVAMATEMKPNTGSSQFFICLDNAIHLRPIFSIFGKVLDGMKTIRAIEKGEADENDGSGQTPKNPVRIINIEITQRT